MVNRTPISDLEQQAINLLHGVTFPVGSWDKRFFRSIASARELSEKERAQLWRLLIRYRRQWDCPDKVSLLAHAARLAAPDFRKQKADAAAAARMEFEKEKFRQAMSAE